MDIYQFWHLHNNDRTAKIIANWLYIIFLSSIKRESSILPAKSFYYQNYKNYYWEHDYTKTTTTLNCQKNPSQRDNFLLKNKNYSKSKLVDVQNSLNMDERQNECEPTCSSDKVVGKSDKKHNVQASNDDDDEEDQEIPQAKLVETYYEYLVLISIILIIFAAFRNSVTWWVHQFIYFHSLAIDAIVSR